MERYPSFFRIVSPSRFQGQAIIDILLYFDWTYVNLVYSKESYGQSGFSYLSSHITHFKICLAEVVAISPDDDSEIYVNGIRKLRKNIKSKVTILFATSFVAKSFFQLAKDRGIFLDHTWLISEGWANTLSEVIHFKYLLKGLLTIQSYSVAVPEFDNYFSKLTINNSNPWVKESIEYHGNCKGNKTCLKQVSLRDLDNFEDDPFSSIVIDSVYTAVSALESLYIESCKIQPCSFKKFASSFKSYTSMVDVLYRTNLTGLTGRIMFDEKGDQGGRYIIRNLKWFSDGEYEFATVGTWFQDRSNSLEINTTDIMWNANTSNIPEAICSAKCPSEMHTRYLHPKCCWECFKCSSNEIYTANTSMCEECPPSSKPDNSTMVCETIEPLYIKWTSGLSICLGCLSFIGCTVSVAVTALFYINNDKHLIRACSRELCYIMLCGITLSYLLVFSLLGKPTFITCLLNRFCFPLSGTLVYAPLAIKSNRIYRIFSLAKKSTRKPRFISSETQVGIAVVFITIQFIICIIWSVEYPPSAVYTYPVPNKVVILACQSSLTPTIIPLGYNLLLILVCIYYAFLSRYFPNNYNESKFIFLSVSTTLSLWVGFIPTLLMIQNVYFKPAVEAIAMIFVGMVTLGFLFISKLYAIYYLNEDKMKICITSLKNERVMVSERLSKNLLTTAEKNIADVSNEQETDDFTMLK